MDPRALEWERSDVVIALDWETRSRRVRARVRRELLSEGVDESDLNRLPEGVVAVGDVVRVLVDELANAVDQLPEGAA